MRESSALLDKLKLTSDSASPVISLACVEQIGYDHFDAVYVPGGHAPMQDLLVSPKLWKLLTNFHTNGKTTALACHGPIALLSALPDAKGFTGQLETNGTAKARTGSMPDTSSPSSATRKKKWPKVCSTAGR